MTVSKADSNEKIRSKTEQTIDRILRTNNIINGASKGNSEKNSLSNKNIPAEITDAEQQTTAIPKFDLAEEILTEQRKITSIKRKAPGKKNEEPRNERKLESIGLAIEQSNPAIFEQDQIIAEIVAMDIEELCNSSLRI
jgi:hypothetical protein